MGYFNSLYKKLFSKKVVIERVMCNSPNSEMLIGKNALVIGGTRGIGKAIVERLSQAGANVIIAGRTMSNIDEYDVGNGLVEFIPFDISNINEHDSFLDKVIQNIGEIDILVNCAGVQSDSEKEHKGFLGITVEDWDYVMNVNLKGVYFLCQAYARRKIQNKTKGDIINICSVTGLKPRPTPYGISKWGATDITKALGTVLAPYNIRVNGVAPGLVNTEMMKSEFRNDIDNYYRADHPDGRCACADDIANIVLFLASDYSSHIAGEVIVCDGSEINR